MQAAVSPLANAKAGGYREPPGGHLNKVGNTTAGGASPLELA